MPLPKPDAAEFKALQRERQMWGREDLPHVEATRRACRIAVGGGYLTRAGAAQLCDWLIRHPSATAQQPGNTLLRGLQAAIGPGAWCEVLERDLLRYITAFYLDDYPGLDTCVLGDLYREPHPQLGDLYASLFDAPSAAVELNRRFVMFTGPFDGLSRRDVFALARAHGAVPTDRSRFADYLFVATSHIEQRVISSTMEAAFDARACLGTPLILTETHWRAALAA